MGLDIFLVTKEEIVAGNFRKVNCLVSWFENNLASITDNVMENTFLYPITKNEVTLLLNDVKSVLHDRSLAQEKLPTHEGFFFGTTGYDEYYFTSLHYVKDVITILLETFDFENQTLHAYIWY